MPDAETSTSTLHGTCYGASVFLAPPRSSLVSASLREFMGSEKRWRENTRQPVCETAVCDSFPHFIHMLWLIEFLGCRHSYSTRVWFSRCITSSGAGASQHAFYMTHYGIGCVTQSNLWWVALMMNSDCLLNSLPGMYLLNRSVLNLILSLELHPMSMPCREPGIDSFPPLQEPHGVLYHLLSHCYRLKENILSGRDCWVFYQLWGE